LSTLGQLAWTTVDRLASKKLLDTIKGVVFDNAKLVVKS